MADDIDVGLSIHADGQNIAKDVTEQIKALRLELKKLFDLQNSSEAKAARKQSEDELAASARSIAAQRKEARDAAKRAEEQARDERAASARQIAADRRVQLEQQRAANKAQLDEQKRADVAGIAQRRASIAQEKAASKQARDEQLASARQISADRKQAVEAERASRRQQRDELRASSRQIAADRAAARDSARSARSVTTTPGDPGVTKNINEQAAALATLGRAVVAAAVAFAGFQGFRAFIQEGLEFNKTIETATLGIASLITAQTKMTDSSGNTIEGIDKLRVANALATAQIQKLRIAGLQTAATTEQLSIAFQQATGVGLRWGLTLDQIRTITIQVSQAALNLGVPLNQLNEEIRSLLTGTITPRNTRIATALGITNQQIRQAQQAGTLFAEVTKRLEAFSIAGEATQRTFVGVMSNLREALQTLAGDATKPLFDNLKAIGIKTMEDIFDMKHARISSKFAGILDVAKDVFGDLGKLLADAIDGAVKGAQELSLWLRQNRVELTAIYESTKLIGDQIGLLTRDVIQLLLPFVEISVTTGLISATLNGIGLVIASIRGVMQVLLLVFADIGSIILTGLLKPLIEFDRIIAKVVGVFNKEWAAALRAAADAGDQFLLGIQQGVKDYTNQLTHGGTALEEFTTKLIDSQDAAQRTAAAQAVLRDSLRDIINAEENQTDVLDKKLKDGVIKQKAYSDQVNEIRINSLHRQIDAQKAYFAAIDTNNDAERRATLTLIKELKSREDALKKNVTLKSIAEPAPAKDSAVKREQAANILIKEILDERLKDLKIMLDQQLISYQDYYNGVIQASIQALDSQIAAQRVLLSSTTDLGAREKIKAQIIAFELEKGQIIEDQDNKRLDSEKKLDEQITALHVQLLKDQGRLSEARALEIGDKFKDLVRQLKAEGRPGDVSVVERLLGIETAKTRLDELTKHATEVQQTLSTRLSAINAEQEAGALNERQAREQIVQAYKNAHKELTSLLPEMRELAKLTEDPTAIDNVEQLSIKFEQMGTTIRRISDDFFRLKTTLKEASTDAIAGIFTGAADVAFQSRSGVDALTEHLTSARKELDRLFTLPATSEVQSRMTQLRNEIESVNQELENSKDSLKSWSDLFVDAARSIVQALQRVISEMLATLIVQQAISFLGFASGGAVNATLSGGDLSKRLPVATGGHIRGAGSGTSDSIPAWLSNGEFVVRERAVRAVGVDLLQEINSQGGASPRGRRRTRGYADGGLVASVSAAEGSLNAVLGLEEGLVVRHMESNAGTRAVLKVIGNNRKSVNAVLGR